MALGGSAQMIVEIKETSVFRSLETLKPMNGRYFEGIIPPQIPDPEMGKYFKSIAEKIVDIIDNFIRSNFVILIIGGSAMASFWGMIRAVQMTSYSAT